MTKKELLESKANARARDYSNDYNLCPDKERRGQVCT